MNRSPSRAAPWVALTPYTPTPTLLGQFTGRVVGGEAFLVPRESLTRDSAVNPCIKNDKR